MTDEEPVSIGALVRRPGFRELLTGQAISALGDWTATVALMALVLEITGSAAAVGGILALRLLPTAMAAPIATRAARNWDRRRTMLTMDAARAGIIVLVPIVRGLWWIYLWTFVLEVLSLVFLPARDATVPELVERDDLGVANGLVLASSYGCIPLGALLFAALSAVPGVSLLDRPFFLVFVLDGASYLVSFAFISRIPQLQAAAEAEAGQEHGGRRAFSIPMVRALLPAVTAISLGLGSLFSLGIVFVQDVLGASDAEFGFLIATFGIGAAAGLGLLRRTSADGSLSLPRIGVAGMGAVVAAFSLSPFLWVAYLGAVGFGLAASFSLATAMSTLQARLDGPDRDIGFTAFHVALRMGLGLAAVGSGAAAELLGSITWPVVGDLEPARVVILSSGLLVLASATLIREPRRLATDEASS